MDQLAAKAFIDALWDAEVIAELTRYIRIPNKSPAFDPDWAAHGHMEAATAQFAAWAGAKIGGIDGASLEVVRLEGRTPVIFIEIPGTVGAGADDPVLLYGHLDKQPEMTGWAEGLGPWEPVLKDGRLYGRGGADDGYAMFGALSAILALKAQGAAHARCAILIEACEESGSYDLPAYVDHLAARIGSPSLVVCLDSGCANYDQLWLTTSLRGMTGGALRVQVLTEGVHSGDASGVVPSSFRIMRRPDLAAGGRGDRRDQAIRAARPDSARPHRRGQGRRRRAGRRGLVQVPVRSRHAAGGRRPRRADPEPYLAAGPCGHRT